MNNFLCDSLDDLFRVFYLHVKKKEEKTRNNKENVAILCNINRTVMPTTRLRMKRRATFTCTSRKRFKAY